MSARKSERLINLLIALLSTRRFLTKRELQGIVEDYRDSGDVAFERQFERDKEELRALGVRIETGSDDAAFETRRATGSTARTSSCRRSRSPPKSWRFSASPARW